MLRAGANYVPHSQQSITLVHNFGGLPLKPQDAFWTARGETDTSWLQIYAVPTQKAMAMADLVTFSAALVSQDNCSDQS
jgi:hypothetical protein